MAVMQTGSLGRSSSYAVLWRDPEGDICLGSLMITANTLRLEGADPQGRLRSVELAADTVDAIRISRAGADRIDRRPALVLRLSPDRTLFVTSAVGLGMIHEMADRLASAGFTLEPSP